jgi:hypothetical protein
MHETANQNRLIKLIGITAAALWLGSATMLVLPSAVHAQDDSAVSSDGVGTADNSAVSDDNAFGAAAAVADPDATVPSIAGSWSGSAGDNRHGTGTVDITFSQLNRVATVSTWSAEYGDSTSLGGSGVGKLNGKSLSLILDDPTVSSKCRVKASGKVTVSDGIAEEIKGNYSLKGCFKKNSKGTFDLFPAT